MHFIKENKILLLLVGVFVICSLFYISESNWYFYLAPLAIFVIYGILFETELVYLSLFFLTPLSVNIEDYTNGFGLFLPTEPILFALLLLVILRQIHENFLPKYLFQSNLFWALCFYIFCLILSTITSVDPFVSLKFLLARLWFIIPCFIFGTLVFQRKANIFTFLWLFIISMSLVMTYTLIVHASNSFGEEESHWVMNPIFKDHTIYGALVAFILPLVVGLFFSRRRSNFQKGILAFIFILTCIALYFSYTRAAWLSIVIALFVFIILKLKIKLSWILLVSSIIGLITLISWNEIKDSLQKNEAEHTTEDFGERIESISNISSDASNLERLNRWSCAFEMFNAKPILGFGPGTYSFEYAKFQKAKNLTIISTKFGDGGNAHSEYIGPLAEIGAIGFISVLILVFFIFHTGIMLYINFDKDDKEMRIIILSMILALVTYFFHGLFNNYLDTDKAAVPIWTICAIFVTLKYKNDSRKITT